MSSDVPPSLGPGARPVGSGGPESPGRGTNPPLDSVLAQVQQIRSTYQIALDDARSRLDISYSLKDRHRSWSLPFDKMPLGSSAQWLLYGGPTRRLTTGIFVTDIIRGAENMAQRDLTQTEAEGHALHASRRMLYSFAAVVSSVTIGVGIAVAGRKTMKFPLRRPKPLEKYDNFPNRFLPILRGQYARVMWHITRANVYTLCAMLLLNPLYSSMGDNAMTVGLYRDSRTTAVLKEMKANKDPNRAFQLQRIGSNVERGSKEDRAQTFAQTAAQREGLESQRGNAVNDEAYSEESYNAFAQTRDSSKSDSTGDQSLTDSTTDTGMLTDREMAQREARQSSPSSFTGVPAYQKGVQQKSLQQQQHERENAENAADVFMLDDASPSGGRGMMDDLSSSQQQPITKSGMGGAWNRVRKGEVTPHAVGKPEEEKKKGSSRPSRAQSSADGFSFSKSDEERQLAKEQAQRDFDRMVEAERKGTSGSGSGGGGAGGGGGSIWGGRPSGRGGL